MKPPPARPSLKFFFTLGFILLAVLGVAVALFLSFRHPAPQLARRPEAPSVPAAPPLPVTNPLPATNTVTRARVQQFDTFRTRPFAVAKANGANEWTAEDGKDTNVIRQLAHNDLEYARMVEENSRIFRRQLVYLKETPASIFEQAKLSGNPVKQLTLPGVDGQELRFEIVKDESKGSSRQGMFSGHLADNADSLVTLAFQDGREAFTVLSPKENIFLVGEPREDGQVIVKVIDPNTYGVGPAEKDDAIKTDSTQK